MALASVGIISIGEMGLGMAKLLLANNYRVFTNVTGRSDTTRKRAEEHGIELVPSDADLCNCTTYILSIVPPRDAVSTAKRIIEATRSRDFNKSSSPRYYLDLNAISPRVAREIDALFADCPDFRYIDGGIIGGPPSQNSDGHWIRPSIPVSGPHELADASPSGRHIADVLNIKHINASIGSAAGLKMCFASLSKGFTALAIQSFTTAEALGVTAELRDHLDSYSPGVRERAERSLVSMPAKAYRWVNEMEQIAETFEADGGFAEDASAFRAIAKVYEMVAGSALGAGEVSAGSADDVARQLRDENERRQAR